MSHEFTREAAMKFLPPPFSWNWCKCLLRSLIHSKISNLTKYREVLVKYSRLITHAEMPLSALNLTPVTGTTDGFIFQIINSLIESWGVCLTWFDCKPFSTGEQTFFGWSLPVILLQKVMVSPGTDLVKNQESQSTTCSWPICNQTVNMKTDSKTPYRSILKLKYSPSTIF